MPDISNIANMLSQLGGPGGLDEEGEIDDAKVQEAQKLFKDCIDQIQKETKEFENQENQSEEQKKGVEETKNQSDLSDPKGEGLDALAGMFKHQENIAKDKTQQTPTNTAQDGSRTQQEDPFA